MRSVYKVLAFLIAIEVAVQAMAMVFAIAGLGKWVAEGGVLDKAVLEGGPPPFPEGVGFFVHGMNGMMVIPALALLLLVTSFFAHVPGAVKWAAWYCCSWWFRSPWGCWATVFPPSVRCTA